MKTVNILHVDDDEFDRALVESVIESSNINVIGSGSLQEFSLLLNNNHKFSIVILDWSFPDEKNWIPKLNISRAFDAAKAVWIDIIYILSWEKLETINSELWPDRKPEGIYLKWIQRKELWNAIKSKITELI